MITHATTNATDGLPRRIFTVDDISRMMEVGIIFEDERFELVEGDIVVTPRKEILHELVRSG